MNLNPITALSEQLQKLITEHGSSTILRDHLALFKDQVVLLEKKSALLETENTMLKAENEKLKLENQQLKIQIQQNKEKNQVKGDLCPYCQERTGKLIDIRPHKIFGEVGLKVGYYHCEKCGKEYDKEQKFQ
jgi:uncharacterized protein with PIN domain